MKLIVGLGNPGPKYNSTRHNAGFRALDRYLERHDARTSRAADGALWNKVTVAGEERYFLKPMDFMNRSGSPLARFTKKHKIEPNQTLVIHDEADLEEGRIQLKLGGGAGGHNGLHSIFEVWGERDFYRLRIGIGKAPDVELSAFVLERAPRVLLDDLAEKAADALALVLDQGPKLAVNTINTRPEVE